jgi:hypothetical protein
VSKILGNPFCLEIFVKNLPIRYILTAFGIVSVGYANSLQAQSTVMFENFLPSVIETNLRNQTFWEPLKNNNSGKTTTDFESNLANFTFKPILAQRIINQANFVSKTKKIDPAGAEQLSQMFSSIDIISAIQQALSPFGLRTDNVVDAYAVYWMSAWHASIGSIDTPSRIQAIKVKQQALQILIAVPEIAQATNAQKQEFAEALLIQTALIDASMEQSLEKPDQLRSVANAVRKGAKAVGLDLDSMTLTSNGFIPTTQGSSVQDGDFSKPQDDTPVEKDFASSKIDGDSSTNYALIAAAGGAGLGGMFLLGKAMGRKR